MKIRMVPKGTGTPTGKKLRMVKKPSGFIPIDHSKPRKARPKLVSKKSNKV